MGLKPQGTQFQSFFLIHQWIGVAASLISTTLQVAYLFMFLWHDFPPPRVVRAASKPKLFSVKILKKSKHQPAGREE